MNRLSAVFKLCKFSLFLKDLFSTLSRSHNSCCCAEWSCKNFSLFMNIVLIFFSYSGPSVILSSVRKQNTAGT